MLALLNRLTRGSSLIERAIRSSALTVLGFGAYQGLRLLSNLVLTRILFPEAFGMMALVTVFLVGLSMFSDMGVGPAIMQSKRGDEPEFLDTAWSLHILRGGVLFLAASALAYPLSLIYAEPELAWYLPVSAVTLLISGFNPTKFETANRHLRTGRVTLVEIGTQVLGLIAAVTLAYLTRSVWALVISGIVSALSQLVLMHVLIPGPRNRFRLEPAAAKELMHFGKWIFLSTLCGFLIMQGDKVILGKYLGLEQFGIYNIGFFLASFPLMLGQMVIRRVVIPVHRESPPRQSRENFLRLRKMRFYATTVLLCMVLGIAALGVWLVDFLYDERYLMAGPVVVTLACMQVVQIIVVSYDQAALAEGDSQRFFVLSLSKALAMTLGLLIGFQVAGLFGALIAQGISMLVIYPVVVWLARAQGAWDPLHDLVFFVAGGSVGAAVFWMHWADISKLIQ
ncbi:polysaccharide biosynthesis protein [Thalassobius vesicularis]|uniref:Polysaccharide biosynthesis protein n=1 Tax=Thalassobius vesicularis TaxID=1294297 RepID=A0A4S3MDG7_9RHOB|nr:oligosaccharide flippase family protein [Thalassobius vesicularis]THD76740.1 polysaccharide biosynthesis protein [Thalassobius vesicularis]